MLEGTILGFDFGTKRIGVAVAETVTRSARPLTIVVGASNEAKWESIASLMLEWDPAALVVGIPRHTDGTPHEMTQRATKFARQLEGRFHKPVYVVDERYSSVDVESEMGKKEGIAIDDAAAAVILEQWFNEGTSETKVS